MNGFSRQGRGGGGGKLNDMEGRRGGLATKPGGGGMGAKMRELMCNGICR